MAGGDVFHLRENHSDVHRDGGAVIPSLPGERSRKVSGSKLKETSFSCGDSHPHLVWRGRAGIWRGYGSPWREALCRRVEAPVGMAA